MNPITDPGGFQAHLLHSIPPPAQVGLGNSTTPACIEHPIARGMPRQGCLELGQGSRERLPETENPAPQQAEGNSTET